MPLPHLMDRRDLLARGSAALALASAPALSAPERDVSRPTGMIDVHHHILPPTAPEGFKRMLAGWSPERAIAGMDRAGIATGIGYPGPIREGSGAERGEKARAWNDYGAGLTRRFPGRCGLFASLPFPDVERTLAEIDHALDVLGADGFGIATSYGDLWLGDEAFGPIWARLNERDAVVFVHPHDAACCAPDKMTYNKPGMDGSWIEWPVNTARAIMSLMVSGTLRRFPRIRFIFAHGGGVMPLLVKRVGGLANWTAVGPEGLARLFPDGVEAEFAALHFECAQACSRPNMEALRSLVPDSRILFGSDYPFFSLPYAADQFAGVSFSAASRRAVARDNARALLPRWA